MNICTKFNDNPSTSYRDISLKTTSVDVIVVLKETSGHHPSHQDTLFGNHECSKFCANPSSIC